MGAEADLRGMLVMVLPEVRQAVGASGGPGTAWPTQAWLKRHHPCCHNILMTISEDN